MRNFKFLIVFLVPLFSLAQTDTDYYDIRDFGGVGNGLASFVQDNAALIMANTVLKNDHHFKVLNIPYTGSAFCFAGTSLIPVDSTTYSGNGTIANINTDAGNGFRGAIFTPCSYSMVLGEEITSAVNCSYAIKSTYINRNFIIVKKLSDADSLKVGMLVGIAGRKCYRGGDSAWPYYSQFMLTQIISRNKDTFFLADKLNSNYNHDAVIIDVNSPKTTRYYGTTPNHISSHIVFDGLTFIQMERNEIDGLPLTQQVGPMIHGGGYKNEVKNCKFIGSCAIGGNMYQKNKIVNLDITVCKNFFDMGCNSSGDSVINISFHYKDAPARSLDSANSFMYLDESNHDNYFADISGDGDWNQISLMRIANSAYNLSFKRIKIDFPLYDSSILIYMRDASASALPVKNISFDSCEFKVKSTSNFVACIGDSVNAKKNRRVGFSNSNFSGEVLTDKSFFIKNFIGITKKEVYINGIKQ